jgi:hypothetical protein
MKGLTVVQWTETERQFVRDHYGQDMTAVEIGATLGRSGPSVGTQAHQLGLSTPREIPEDVPEACKGGRQGPVHARLKAEIIDAVRAEYGPAVEGCWTELTLENGRIADLVFATEEGLLPVEIGDTRSDQLADLVRTFGFVCVCPYVAEDRCGRAWGVHYTRRLSPGWTFTDAGERFICCNLTHLGNRPCATIAPAAEEWPWRLLARQDAPEE